MNIGNYLYHGVYGMYPTSGYIQDLARDRKRNIALLKHLRDTKWTNRETRALFLDLTIYNVNINVFTVIK